MFRDSHQLIVHSRKPQLVFLATVLFYFAIHGDIYGEDEYRVVASSIFEKWLDTEKYLGY